MISIKKNPETVGKLKVGTSAATPADGEVVATSVKAETYRSARSDGDVYIQAATASDFVAIGTQVSSNLLKVDGSGNVTVNGPVGTNFGDSTSLGLEVTSAGHQRVKVHSTSTTGHAVAYDLETGNTGPVVYTGSLKISGAGALSMQTAGSDRLTIDSTGLITSTSQIQVTSSNVTGVAFSVGDAGTGWYNTGSNAIGLATNGEQRINVSNSGLATFSAGVTVSGGNVQAGATAAAVSSGKIMSYFDGNIGNGLQIHDTNTGAGTGHLAAIFTRNTSVIGSISTTASATAFNTSSDYRLKENLTPLTGALDRLDQLPVYRFNFTADPDTTVDGFVAHEVSAHVPEAVTGDKDAMKTVVVQEAVEAVEAQPATYWEEGDELPEGVAVGDEKTAAVEAVEAVEEVTEEQIDPQGIDQSKLVPLLVAAVKELKAKVENLENA